MSIENVFRKTVRTTILEMEDRFYGADETINLIVMRLAEKGFGQHINEIGTNNAVEIIAKELCLTRSA